MTKQSGLVALATIGSATLLLAAFGFQHLGGLAPCKMCIWQRYPHAVAIAIGAVALALPRFSILPLLGAAAAATTAAIGVFHAGVEQGWWEGPSSCTSGDISGLSTDDLFDQIMNAPLVRCDDIPWEMFGISMAGWNAIASAVLMLIWIAAWRARA
ncbi:MULTISPECIES: disulfide bond formation protein B [unclassified Ruegeria]|uniref:disulfide bond formation protein B n=1 Tax=unclassified Ruegeria TaxID=2625375 RepID=UPI001489781D|nr:MULTISPECIES: disulfide bond formation protein B [unclassified Ruegeria]NOD46328.1 disulfide bond formation protein B [Ruegeria sp. HKCCD5849]NOD50372.1 disulfide bond formation protein B [Ruegeria sp. HKCCD5851]NOD67188.1 disulfide bond formation protein B [Ruegeria sp. HKCCD7303]NOE32777.1 disulfide bond formation protein B [Ruegeria sp. HKCCD7318]